MALDLRNKREVFWDDYLINTEKTTAKARLHEPREAGIVMECNEPWEGNSCDFFNILREPDGLLRMYYLAWNTKFRENDRPIWSQIVVCYAESSDNGLSWIKPKLGIKAHNGSSDNNIILTKADVSFAIDNFFVFRDDNPKCPPEERYKAILCDNINIQTGIEKHKRELWCYVSSDAINFTRGFMMTDRGSFDSLNTAMWDAEREIYHCFIRGTHGHIEGVYDSAVRDIRHITSKDFRNWSDAEMLKFDNEEDYALYTNCISQYERAPQIYVGFPSRYINRGSWTANYDRLCGREERKIRMNWEDRIGLVMTDCVFMFSRDMENWYRCDEAFMRPGPERKDNWIYGDCYPAVGIFETPGPHGTESELSIFSEYQHFAGDVEVMRYTLRKDGFISLNAPYSGADVVTKPFVFGGKGISINFSTSARGYVYVTLRSKDGKIARSCELFGDSCDRIVDFDCDLSEFEGVETVMEIKMRDADIYSVKFD